MTIKNVPCCENCDKNISTIPNALTMKRPKYRGNYHFCDFDCVSGFIRTSKEVNENPKRKYRKETKKRDLSKWRCGACGMLCPNPWILGKHIKARHNPAEYLSLVKETGGVVIDSDGKIQKSTPVSLIGLKNET